MRREARRVTRSVARTDAHMILRFFALFAFDPPMAELWKNRTPILFTLFAHWFSEPQRSQMSQGVAKGGGYGFDAER